MINHKYRTTYWSNSVLLTLLMAITLLTKPCLSKAPTKKSASVATVSSTLHDNIIDSTCKKIGLNLTPTGIAPTQTAAYLRRTDLKAGLINYKTNLEALGSEFCTTLLEEILKKELSLTANYYVFYHGQMRDFMLPQDIYTGLYEIAYKKLLTNFIILRTLNKDLEQFDNVNTFLNHHIKSGEIKHWDFDCKSHVRKHLLCVNPSLFSNSNCSGECSFYYFIHSTNCYSPGSVAFAKDVFKMFNYEQHYTTHYTALNELSTLLSSYETNKTGALLQIFIGKSLVNKVAYRCIPWGLLYHSDSKPEKHPASQDLEEYKKSTILDSYNYDATQFRLLMNKTLLSPESDVKMFRYCNENTPNMKKYRAQMKNLLEKIKAAVA